MSSPGYARGVVDVGAMHMTPDPSLFGRMGAGAMRIVRMAMHAAEQAQDAVEEGCLRIVILVVGVSAVGLAVAHLWV